MQRVDDVRSVTDLAKESQRDVPLIACRPTHAVDVRTRQGAERVDDIGRWTDGDEQSQRAQTSRVSRR